MSTIILIALGAICVRVWWAWHQSTVQLNKLTPQARAALEDQVARRRAYIIEDGLKQYREYKQAHPVLGRLRPYDAQGYYIKHNTDISRYPHGNLYMYQQK